MDPAAQPDPAPEHAPQPSPPPLPPEVAAPTAPAVRPGPILPPSDRSRRRAFRPTPPSPGRRLRMFILACAVATLAGITAIAVSLIYDGPNRTSPWPTAEQFVTWLAFGAEPDSNREDDRIGYALAHDLFTERLQRELPWIDFHQSWVLLTRQHGDVMATERITRQSRRGDRGRRRFRYRLRLGSEREHHEDMMCFILEFTLKRTEDGEYLVDAYHLAPSDGLQR